MPVAHNPDHPSDPGSGSTPDQQSWGRTVAPSPSPQGRRFTGAHLAAAGVSSLLVGVLATSLAFTLIGSDDDGGEDADMASQDSPAIPAGALDEPVAEAEETEVQDDVIGVGDGFTVTTWDGLEIETYVHDFSVDNACKYGGVNPRIAEKAPDSRIVQLTIDVANHGDDTYSMDKLTALSGEGYTQPVESATRFCNEPDDGANRWPGFGHIDQGEKKLLYGAFEVQPDAAELVLVSTGNGKVLIDIPDVSAASGGGDGSPEPTTSAG